MTVEHDAPPRQMPEEWYAGGELVDKEDIIAGCVCSKEMLREVQLSQMREQDV